ncbi:hypothetical protein EMIHUDRAFT_452293, partial [Emiliania huxleyi CCMP1516]
LEQGGTKLAHRSRRTNNPLDPTSSWVAIPSPSTPRRPCASTTKRVTKSSSKAPERLPSTTRPTTLPSTASPCASSSGTRRWEAPSGVSTSSAGSSSSSPCPTSSSTTGTGTRQISSTASAFPTTGRAGRKAACRLFPRHADAVERIWRAPFREPTTV